MWTCPNCGEANEDQFQECWKCVSDTLPQAVPASPEPSRPLRPLSYVLVRALTGFVVGTLAGVAVFQRQSPSLPAALLNGLCFGLFSGSAVGCLVWVISPYQPPSRIETPDAHDHPEP